MNGDSQYMSYSLCVFYAQSLLRGKQILREWGERQKQDVQMNQVSLVEESEAEQPGGIGSGSLILG